MRPRDLRLAGAGIVQPLVRDAHGATLQIDDPETMVSCIRCLSPRSSISAAKTCSETPFFARRVKPVCPLFRLP